MFDKTGKSEERTDIFGNKYTQHYDTDGNKAGRSEENTDLFGNTYAQHYDKDGNKAGTSEARESFWGSSTQHYDQGGHRVGESRDTDNIFGQHYAQHYDERGSRSGTSEVRRSMLAGRYTQHYGHGGMPSDRGVAAASMLSTSSDGSTVSDVDQRPFSSAFWIVIVTVVVALTVLVLRQPNSGPAWEMHQTGNGSAWTVVATIKAHEPVKPAAIWRPQAQAHEQIRADCMALQGDAFSKCVIGVMKRSGASRAAITFTMEMHGEGFLRQLEHIGPVDLARVEYFVRANDFDDTFFVNGAGGWVEPASQLRNLRLGDDAGGRELLNRHPKALVWPTVGDVRVVEAPEGVRQRFLASFPVFDGCHACPLIGNADVAFDFADDGQPLSARLVNVSLSTGARGQ